MQIVGSSTRGDCGSINVDKLHSRMHSRHSKNTVLQHALGQSVRAARCWHQGQTAGREIVYAKTSVVDILYGGHLRASSFPPFLSLNIVATTGDKSLSIFTREEIKKTIFVLFADTIVSTNENLKRFRFS